VSYGLHLAGYEVVGADIEPQPRYPFEFHQADALTFPLEGYDLICASPPCQRHSRMSNCRPGLAETYPDLIGPIRERLIESGVPYMIENVEGSPLIKPITLCGAMFGLKVLRHRLFEASFPIPQPEHPAHNGSRPRTGRPPKPGDVMTVAGHTGDVNYARAAMGAWWMSDAELSESIPPAYSIFTGLAAAAEFGYELQPLSVTLEGLRRARSNALAAERMRRYRARQKGRKGQAVAMRKSGPQPKMISHYAAELAKARTELAALKAAGGDAA